MCLVSLIIRSHRPIPHESIEPLSSIPKPRFNAPLRPTSISPHHPKPPLLEPHYLQCILFSTAPTASRTTSAFSRKTTVFVNGLRHRNLSTFSRPTLSVLALGFPVLSTE